MIPTFPCCEHCVPESDGFCWAVRVGGHGAHCIDCQTPVSRVQAIEAAEDHADQVIFDAARERRL